MTRGASAARSSGSCGTRRPGPVLEPSKLAFTAGSTGLDRGRPTTPSGHCARWSPPTGRNRARAPIPRRAPRSSCGSCAPPWRWSRWAARRRRRRRRAPGANGRETGSARAQRHVVGPAEVLLTKRQEPTKAWRGSRARPGRTPTPPAPAPTRSTRSCWPAARWAAEEPLQRVVAEAGRAGARRLHDAAARELRRIGSRPSGRARRAAERGDSALSAREQEIARLVADGKFQQAGGGDALSEREDRRERAHAHLRQARRSLTRGAEPPPPPRRASDRRAGR